MFIKKFFKWSVMLTAILLFLQGCGVWRNFTTYFNTYFNAKSLFDSTEEEIIKQKTDIFEFKEPKITTQNSQNLTKVIEKCSKILQFDVESAYFPDALFLTGKSFYYQEEYSKAERKFIELAGLNNSQYDILNKYWLGKTKLQLREFDDGIALLQDAQKSALAEGEEDLFRDANITEISFLIYRENYTAAIEKAKSFLTAVDDEEIKALLSYQLGKIYLLSEDYENAATAFGNVLNYAPTFQVEFDSKIEYARLLKKLNREDESLTVLEELKDQDKFKSNHDKVFLELAYIYRDRRDTSKALDLLRQVDSTFKQTESAGLAEFEMGDLYERDVADYDSSFKYYSKAAGSLAPRDLKLEAGTRARDLTKYFTFKNNVSGLEKQLLYINEPQKFVQDSIDYEFIYKNVLEELQAANPNFDFSNTVNPQANNQTRLPQQQQQQLEQQDQQPDQQLAQQQQQQVQQNPAASSVELSVLVGPTTKLKDKELQQQIIKGKIKKPVRPNLPEDTLKTRVAKNYLDMGNLFISELEVPDSAVFYYDKILTSFPDSKYKVQALYALGTIYESEEMKEKADSLFNIIYTDYPKDPIASEAGKKLGLVANEGLVSQEGKSDPAFDMFLDAEKKYFNKDYSVAVENYKEIYAKFPESVFAPKALLAAGMIYEQNLKLYDSAAVVYGRLTKKFDKSNYAKSVAGKLEAYNQEKNKQKQQNTQSPDSPESLTKQNDKKPAGAEGKAQTQMKPAVPDSLAKKEVMPPSSGIKDSLKTPAPAEKFENKADTSKQKTVNAVQDSIGGKKKIKPDGFEKAKPDTTKKRIDY